MKVKELIEELQKCEQEAIVILEQSDSYDIYNQLREIDCSFVCLKELKLRKYYKTRCDSLIKSFLLDGQDLKS